MPLSIYKNIGETTGEFSKRIVKMIGCKKVAICGKLDPLAHGYTNILVDDECSKMSDYLTTDKTYRFIIGTGWMTDTDDLMGLPSVSCQDIDQHQHLGYEYHNDPQYIDSCIHDYCNHIDTQPFHHFSAINIVKNSIRKPLHYWYLSNMLLPEDIPKKKVFVRELSQPQIITINDYKQYVINKLSLVKGNNFRQSEIIKHYNDLHDRHFQQSLHIEYTITVSSGFYIRMIAKELNEKYGTCIHITDIERLSI